MVNYIKRYPQTAATNLSLPAFVLLPALMSKLPVLRSLLVYLAVVLFCVWSVEFCRTHEKKWQIDLEAPNRNWGRRHWVLWWMLFAQSAGSAGMVGVFFWFCVLYIKALMSE